MKFLTKLNNEAEECSDENDDVCFDVAHSKWLKERNAETGHAVVYWLPKPYLTSTYAKKERDPEDDWLICPVQIKQW